MSDRAALTRAFEASGMQSAVAERIATEIYEPTHENVATKADLQQVEAVLKADLRELEQRLDLRFAAIDTRFEQAERQIGRMVTRLGAASS
jgi:transcriptional regulator NrdR family protein